MADVWQLRFTADQVFLAKLAAGRPDRGLVLASRDQGGMALYTWDVDSGEQRPLAAGGHAFGYQWIDPPGDHVYLLHDTDGSEHGHLVRLPFEGGPMRDLTPDLEPYTLRGVGFSADGGTLAFNPINSEGFAVYVQETGPEPGAPRLVFRDSFETKGSLVAADGSLVACWSTARAGGVRQHTLLVFDTRTGERVGELDDGPDTDVTGAGFSPVPGDDRILAQTNRTGFVRPLLWNPRTGERTDLELGGGLGDVASMAWSPDGRAVLLCETGGAQRLHRFDLDSGTDRVLDHPSGTYYDILYGGPMFTTPESIVAVRNSAVMPPDVIELDAATGRLRRTLLASTGAPPAHPWRSVTFTSSDGTPIQAFVATPPGEGPFPTVVELHGGPHITQLEHYDPAVAGWLDHGYAWISPNFRGSIGFGRKFAEQIWGHLGRYELEDMVAAREWAVREGIARPDEVFAYGASYGGYMALLAAGRQPDLWAGAIGLAALADLVTVFHEMSDAMRGALSGWMRGTPEERPEAYAESSPITYAADVRAPILIVQLANDTRTPPEQVRNYVNRLRELGKRVDLEWFGGGHASVDAEAFVSAFSTAYAFADRVLAERRAVAEDRSQPAPAAP
ncbi:MAG TPA: prolyl oligopeptidase family serine peptidase [Micromonosporaceae bacterium]|nr:prolyl oligopeptidase family serine peptidase [Micromonosporaceae bacterium]